MSDLTERRERAAFAWWTQMSSRWADCDAYGHVNNAMYYNWFDTALTTLAIERGLLKGPGQTSIGLCVASGCEFLAPVGFPQTVDIGVSVGHLGGKSITYELGMFARDASSPAALCRFTHVYVDRDTRRAVALSDDQRSAASLLMQVPT